METNADQMIQQSILLGQRNALVDNLIRTTAMINQGKGVTVPQVQAVKEKQIDKTKSIEGKKTEPRKIAKPQTKPQVKIKTEKHNNLEKEKIDGVEKDKRLHSINGVHLDLYDYFSIPPMSNNDETLRRLQFINSWVATEGETFGKGLRKLYNIDMKLGSSDTGDTKLIKLYNWIRFSGKK